MTGAIGHKKGRGILGRHIVGDRHADIGGNGGIFGQPQQTAIGCDPLTNGQIGHALTYGGDAARKLHPQREGQIRLLLIGALDHQQVTKVQPAGIDLDQHFASGGDGHFQLLFGQGLVIGGDLHGAHRGILLLFHAKGPEHWRLCNPLAPARVKLPNGRCLAPPCSPSGHDHQSDPIGHQPKRCDAQHPDQDKPPGACHPVASHQW